MVDISQNVIMTTNTAPTSGSSLVFNGTNFSPARSIVRLYQNILSANTNTVDITSISQNYTDLICQVVGRSSAATTSVPIRMTFNNDSGTNYDYARENRFGRGAGFNVAYIEIGNLVASSAPAGFASNFRFTIPNYTGTTFNKHVFGQDNLSYGSSDANTFPAVQTAQWKSTSAVNRITLTDPSGNFLTGTSFSLYGI